MKKSDQLKQLRAQKIEAQKAIHTTAEAEKRSLTEAETTQFRALQGEITDLNTQIEDAVAYETNLRSLEGKTELPKKEGEEGKEGKQKRSFSINAAIRSLLAGEALSGAEKEANDAAIEAAKRSGVSILPGGMAIPMFESRADGQTVTEDTGGYGGNLVATEVMDPIDYLQPRPIAATLGAVQLFGLQGNILFPKNNGGVTATWEGEVDTVTNTKDAIGKVEMSPKRLSVSVLVSLQNLMQSTVSMEIYTMNTIKKAIEVAIDKAYFAGSGTGEPTGIINTSGVNTVAIGTNGGALTLDKAIDMETEVFIDNADSNSLYYVSNSKVRGKAKKTVIESGQTAKLLQNNEINGYPYYNTNHLPSNLTKGTASGVCSAAVFGDFSKSIIGQWGFMDLSVDNYSRKKDGYIEITANVYLDIAVTQPTAFTVVKDLTTT